MNALKHLVKKFFDKKPLEKDSRKRENVIIRNMYKTGYICIVRFCVISIYYKMTATKNQYMGQPNKKHALQNIYVGFYIFFKLSIRTALSSGVK
jgi:hypothetical protein